ncbi:MAG: YaiO family outer membrane beta-barrel protein [Deltaproteobacteria bacterium]|nr:YaiO family outer membrane beta-barrel protein [Deltaproteobacteria bacterium]
MNAKTIWRMVGCALFLAVLHASAGPATAADPASLDEGNALIGKGEFRAAAGVFSSVLEKEPANRDARIGLARALGFSGDHAGGEREFRAVLAAAPGDVEARLGLSDVLAWRKRYGEADEVLSGLDRERPNDPEVLVRRGKVALWSGDREGARKHFEAAVLLAPGNTEAARGLEQAKSGAGTKFTRVAEGGVSLLRIRRANPGTQVWSAVRDASSRDLELQARVDYLHRFGQDEVRGTAGAVRKWEGGLSLRGEAGFSPHADIFSRYALEAEAGLPLQKGLAAYLGAKYADYATAEVWNAIVAVECYVLPKDALLARYVFSNARFDGGGDSDDGTWMAKATHFFTDADRAWAYYSHGKEGYATGTADQIGNVTSNTYGLGGRIFPVPRWGAEGNFEWQEREGGNRYLTFTLVGYHRF